MSLGSEEGAGPEGGKHGVVHKLQAESQSINQLHSVVLLEQMMSELSE